MLVQRLLAAKRDLRLSQELRKLDKFAALFIDDIGYVQQDREEMEILFTLLAERYEGTRLEIEQHLERLTDDLLHEGLVIASSGSSPASAEPSPDAAAPRQPFGTPTLHKYTEMRDLLALDPPMPVLEDSADP